MIFIAYASVKDTFAGMILNDVNMQVLIVQNIK